MAETVQPARATVTEALGDYLPLPISQQYPKRGTHKLGPKKPADGENEPGHTEEGSQELLGWSSLAISFEANAEATVD